ncbi:hypothetical protein, partial [Parabacteroides distasonis]
PDPVTIAPVGVAYAGTGWGISARPFTAALKRGGGPYSQKYGTALMGNDAAVVNAWTIAAAPASGSRIDLLAIRAKDASQGDSIAGAPTDGPGGVVRAIPEFVTVTGVAGTPGNRPALPAGLEEVAQITTPSGAASAAGSTIVPTYKFAHVVGAPIVVRNYAELDALTGVLGIDSAYIIDKGAIVVRRGSGWVPTAPAVLGKYRSLSAGNVWIDAATPADFPVAADKTALDGTFDKLSATSDVRMTFFALGELASGPEQIITASLNVGGTDYEVASTPFLTATSRGTFAGTRIASGIPRGTHAVKPRMRTSAANFRIYSGWIVSYTIEEV